MQLFGRFYDMQILTMEFRAMILPVLLRDLRRVVLLFYYYYY